jgi:hypothetical protein
LWLFPCLAGDVRLCDAPTGWVAPAAAADKAAKKKKKGGEGNSNAGEQQQQQGDGEAKELDPEKAAKKVRQGNCVISLVFVTDAAGASAGAGAGAAGVIKEAAGCSL